MAPRLPILDWPVLPLLAVVFNDCGGALPHTVVPDIDLAPPLVAPADPLGFATDICVCPIRRNGDAQENERRAPVGPKPDHGLAG